MLHSFNLVHPLSPPMARASTKQVPINSAHRLIWVVLRYRMTVRYRDPRFVSSSSSMLLLFDMKWILFHRIMSERRQAYDHLSLRHVHFGTLHLQQQQQQTPTIFSGWTSHSGQPKNRSLAMILSLSIWWRNDCDRSVFYVLRVCWKRDSLTPYGYRCGCIFT